jgi:hypothetical protein
MRGISIFLATLLAVASPALAGITVTSYSTVALTNAWAPVGGTLYFEREELLNVSPAFAQTSGDWMGRNAGGSTNTWHYVGSAQVTSTTTFDANSLIVTAAGSFGYDITTTADFRDPRSASVFTPGATANYEGFFTTDVPVTYSISVELQQWGKVFFGSFATGFIFNEVNPSTTPRLVQRSGTVAPGQYQLGASAGLGAPNLSNGVNHYMASGSFANLTFTVQVPEPNSFGSVITMVLMTLRRRTRCVGAR